MAKITRTEKYRELRESLANDQGQEVRSKELDRFQSRLNRLDSVNFEAPYSTNSDAEEHDPIHARRSTYTEEAANHLEESQNIDFDIPKEEKKPVFQEPQRRENTYNSNDYLDRYINEVKQYNIDQGNAVSENTQVNILNRLRQDEVPQKPYREESRSDYKKPETTEVPFLNTQPRNARDIAFQVQHLVDTGRQEMPSSDTRSERRSHMDTDEFSRHLEMERTTRQQLLDETTQMRAKLDDYEDNLSEVSDKMRHTNQILNTVLIVLIIALVFVLGVVIYWIFLSNGGN